MAYYSRSAWTNAANAAPSIKYDQIHTTIHYPGFGNSSLKTANWSRDKSLQQIKAWRSMHVPKSYKEIAYNFFVLSTGDVVEGRGFRQNGANGTSSANRVGLSIQVLIGDNEELNAKFLKGLADCFALIKARYPNAVKRVYGHQHWVPTSCPGKAIMSAIKNGTINGNMKGSVSVPSGGTSAPKPSTPSSNVWETSPRIKGMSKETVKEIQTKLVKAGFSVGSYGVDGSYKAGTTKAVKEFQKKHGLTVDGVAGPATISKLNDVIKGSTTTKKPAKPAKKPAAKPSTKKLKVDGRFGTETVKEIQRRLGVKVDGRAGKDTWTALQKKKGMKYVDGIISKQSYKASELGNGIVAGKYWDYTGRGSSGSSLIKAIQKDLGVSQDGILYTNTIKKLQERLNNDPNYLK